MIGPVELLAEVGPKERLAWRALEAAGGQVELLTRHDAAAFLLGLDIRVRWDPVILVDPTRLDQ